MHVIYIKFTENNKTVYLSKTHFCLPTQ